MPAERDPRRRRAVAARVSPAHRMPAALLAAATVALAAAPAPDADAAISHYTAEHTIRLTSQHPFTVNTLTDHTGSDPLTATPFAWSETQGSGQFEVRATQDLTVTPDRIEADLSATMFDVGTESGGIASSRIDLGFTLDAPANLTVTGSGNGGFGPFSGGRTLYLQPVPGTSDDALITLTGLDAINYGTAVNPQPIALPAGRYDLVVSAGLANRAVGTRINSVLLQFAHLATLAGDFNGSGGVEQGDLDLVLSGWGTPRGNWGNADGFATTTVDQEELDAVLSHWGTTAAPGTGLARPGAVPEPASGAAATLLLAGLRTRRRRA